MKLLLHICCAPCSVACVQSLRAEGLEPTGYWYNPNIHPFTEYRARKDTLEAYARDIGLAMVWDGAYGLRPFARTVAADPDARCLTCYAARMRQTARYAAEHGYTHFTSTLFISPYQRHNLLRAAAEEAAEAFGVAFLYRDFRPLFHAGQEEARARGLYLQKYCGCVFSEEERYSKRYRVKRPRGQAAPACAPGVEPAPAPDPLAEAAAREAAEARQRLEAREALRCAGLAFEAAWAAWEAAPPRTPGTAAEASPDGAPTNPAG